MKLGICCGRFLNASEHGNHGGLMISITGYVYKVHIAKTMISSEPICILILHLLLSQYEYVTYISTPSLTTLTLYLWTIVPAPGLQMLAGNDCWVSIWPLLCPQTCPHSESIPIRTYIELFIDLPLHTLRSKITKVGWLQSFR